MSIDIPLMFTIYNTYHTLNLSNSLIHPCIYRYGFRMSFSSSTCLSVVLLVFVICSLGSFIGKSLLLGGWTAENAQISPLRYLYHFTEMNQLLFYCSFKTLYQNLNMSYFVITKSYRGVFLSFS